MTRVGVVEQLPGALALAAFEQHEAGLFQGGEIAGLSVALLPLRRGARLRRLRGVAIQALPEDGIAARIVAGLALAELLAGQLQVLVGQPVDGLQARALQFIAQLAHQRRIITFTGQLPQLLALLGVLQLLGGQALQPALGLLVVAHGDGAVGHGQAGAGRRVLGRCAGQE